jgi:hypothetical protein
VFFPPILEPRRRIDQALYAVVMEAYVHGVSTRSVDDLVAALGGTRISNSEVSRTCAGGLDPYPADDAPTAPTASSVMSPLSLSCDISRRTRAIRGL